ncbi:phosphodiester glycosidase family protein [Coleofasciculus sp. FACHB-501]|uniref:phosphodiester glycosidase family protein n=1 Tax=Cyanophyceae TaxID=3028117 RepID=UPI0016851DA6|nr:phosphodiester glycosidase family protein [Coleofasciculus sp. FACHB-501]MBD1839645.1 phosphodiester glycosidase family protein [Coleofasciculus sp. FACHB-501]
MPDRKQPNGCRKMLRRTFLFLVGLALAQVLTEFFSIPQNRSNFASLVRQLWEKAIAFWESQNGVAQKPLPSSTPTPISSVSPEPLPSPTPKTSTTSKPSQPSSKTNVNPAVAKGKPVQVTQKTLAGVSFYQTTIDLSDPETLITLGLANNATYANGPTVSNGDEPFAKLVARQKAAVVANGTFFDKSNQKWVMGNMVAAGRFLKYSRWENYGTTLGIKAGNQLEMITARTEGQPNWDQHWFSITCGPRLIKQGKISISPQSEGFADPHVLGVGYRTAIGFPANRKQLFLISFLASLSLQQEANIMKAIGCIEAMNLDGGASEALAHNGRILLPAGRNLTNVIVVYDTNYPAPSALKTSWQRFQAGDRPSIPL